MPTVSVEKIIYIAIYSLCDKISLLAYSHMMCNV